MDVVRTNGARRKLNIVFQAGIDYVFTSEPKNMAKYPNTLYHPIMYSMLSDNKPAQVEWDLYLTANGSKDRLKIFQDIFAYANQGGEFAAFV